MGIIVYSLFMGNAGFLSSSVFPSRGVCRTGVARSRPQEFFGAKPVADSGFFLRTSTELINNRALNPKP